VFQRKLIAAVVVSLFLSIPLLATPDKKDTEKRLQESAQTLDEIMSAPDKGIPQDLLQKAACLVVVPGAKKAALVVGGKYGRGFMACRNGKGGWSSPAGVRIEGGSVGFQIGASETDIVMLVMNQDGANKLLGNKFTFGADATATAGPVGRSASAATDAQLHAQILTYSRAKGLFAGVSLEGATLRTDDDANKDLYAKEISNKEIVSGTVPAPTAATALLTTIKKYAGA
jgi:lipid-binding SYLF domain-containing protein